KVTDNFWPGISLAWQALYGKDVKTITRGNTTFTGTIATSLNVFPMLATGNYYFMTDPRGVRPYAGLGVGAYAAEHRLDVGIWTISDTSWHFGFAPEIGATIAAALATLAAPALAQTPAPNPAPAKPPAAPPKPAPAPPAAAAPAPKPAPAAPATHTAAPAHPAAAAPAAAAPAAAAAAPAPAAVPPPAPAPEAAPAPPPPSAPPPGTTVVVLSNTPAPP